MPLVSTVLLKLIKMTVLCFLSLKDEFSVLTALKSDSFFHHLINEPEYHNKTVAYLPEH